MTVPLKVKGDTYDLFEVLSALQKAIRRGEEANAVYWATALDMGCASSRTALWGRLFTIASEDIGVANSNAIVQLKTLYECWKGDIEFIDSKGNPKTQRYGEPKLHLIHAVVMLARSPKSRICDHLCILAYGSTRKTGVPIPDEALDKHTIRGRAMKRGFRHFFEVGAKLEKSHDGIPPLPDPYEAKCRELLCSGKKGEVKKPEITGIEDFEDRFPEEDSPKTLAERDYENLVPDVQRPTGLSPEDEKARKEEERDRPDRSALIPTTAKARS